MISMLIRIGIHVGLGAALLLAPMRSWALQSTSYVLYDEAPNFAARDSAVSTRYRLNEAGITWFSQPLHSTSYSLVNAPPEVTNSSSSASSTAETEQGASPHGGHRGSNTARSGIAQHRAAAPKLQKNASPLKSLKSVPHQRSLQPRNAKRSPHKGSNVPVSKSVRGTERRITHYRQRRFPGGVQWKQSSRRPGVSFSTNALEILALDATSPHAFMHFAAQLSGDSSAVPNRSVEQTTLTIILALSILAFWRLHRRLSSIAPLKARWRTIAKHRFKRHFHLRRHP